MFDLKFEKVEDAQVWHEEVLCYKVEDASSSELLGHFYLDMYPRDDKFNHAAVFPMIKRAKIEG